MSDYCILGLSKVIKPNKKLTDLNTALTQSDDIC